MKDEEVVEKVSVKKTWGVKSFVVGLAVGLIPAVIMFASSPEGIDPLGRYHDADTINRFMESEPKYQPKWDLSYMSYAGGIVSDKVDRFYQRGTDWIVIKDFPENIDSHSEAFKSISDILWYDYSLKGDR